MPKAKTDVWDTSVEVESNFYNWTGKPILTPSAKADRAEFIHLDLFSGCGGFSIGFEQAGFTTQVAVDIHPPSLETLRNNHRYATTICGDIRKVSTDLIRPHLSSKLKHLVITAGVPCQGFSLANRKRHADDKRNFLFKEFIRLASELKPTCVVLENVSGLVSTGSGEFKKAIAGAIQQLGYDVHFAMLNAADYGVPQKRRRVFFIGVPNATKWLFPSPTHGLHLKPYNTVGDAILGDLPELNAAEESHSYTGPSQTDLQRYLRGDSAVLLNHQAPSHPESTIEMISRTAPGKPMYAKFKQRIRLHPNEPSPTQICGGIRPQFQFGHPTQARGLTIRERARIQSFPDSYNFHGGITQGRVQTGNAVPPMLVNALAVQIMKLLRNKPLSGISGDLEQLEFF